MISVLFADDDTDFTCLVEKSLQGFAEVTIAKTGEEVLELCKDSSKTFHCIVLDVHLPGISGVEVVKQLQGVVSIPLILISGSSKEECEKDGVDFSKIVFMEKPFSLKDFKTKIATLCRAT